MSGDRIHTHFETRKVAALLAYLALGLESAHPREILAEQLWPGEEWDAIRNRLRHALSSLRGQFESASEAAVIISDRLNVRLNPHSVTTDVIEFERKLRLTDADADCQVRARSLRQAVDLYTGELLPGFYDDWVCTERSRLEEAYRDALARLARGLAEIGDLHGAIDRARRALSRDPLREDVHCDLMRFYAQDGRPSDVIRQFRELERILREELGAQPSPATCDQFEELQRGLARTATVSAAPDELTARVTPGLEPDGGAVPLDSRFYVIRSTDADFQSAVQRRDSIVLVKGPRQVGKTSLLARSLQEARASGARVVLTDLQKAMPEHLHSPESLFEMFSDMISDQLDLETGFHDVSDPRRGWNVNFERFMRREVLRADQSPLVWALDEVDRLFGCSFSGLVFGLFRSWHNERALNPSGPWSRLTLAMAYATEAHLFIADLNQSPFNVGTRLALDDFTPGEVAELNRRYGSPIRNPEDLKTFYDLVGGCPYLVRRGLHVMVERGTDLAEMESEAAQNDGLFGDHLRRLATALVHDATLSDEVRRILEGRGCTGETSFYRLRSAGVLVGRSPETAAFRCGIYRKYFSRIMVPEHKLNGRPGPFKRV